MPPLDGGPSSIRVFVRWHDQTVFAGEEVKCRITFKNVAPGPQPSPPRSASSASGHNNASAVSKSNSSPSQTRHHNHSDGSRQASPLLIAQNNRPQNSPSPSGLAPPRPSRGHRSTLSLSSPPTSTSSSSRNRSGSAAGWASLPPPPPPGTGPGSGSGSGLVGGQQRNGSHRRSLSIVSLGSAADGQQSQGNNATVGSLRSPRPHKGHARASSLQIVPRGSITSGPRSASHPHGPFNAHPSPLFNASFPTSRSSGSGTPSAPNTPRTPGLGAIGNNTPGLSPRPTPESLSNFKFPMQSPLSQQTNAGVDSPEMPLDESVISPTETIRDMDLPSRANNLPIPTINEGDNTAPTAPATAAAARILSTSSIAGTPRSSTEFYSMSNNSTETLASEYVTTQPPPHRTPAGGGSRPPHLRQRSNLSGYPHSQPRVKAPEALMMGYAQIQGSFTLDGSLVDLGPFEQVKRKAVVGGQGGGVIGVETHGGSSKRESGLLRSFGWGSLTSSIGELLGGGELSSIKEMGKIASSKAVPLLSTPQSILFVDLRLAPGESRSYEYSFRLPKGLPPTHKGKAMKISYSLVIGTQRPGGAKEQQMRSVEVPFRVLGSVNGHGEILGHDLMAPYVLLRDLAKVLSLDDDKAGGSSGFGGSGVGSGARDVNGSHSGKQQPKLPSSGTMAGFLSYVDELLQRPRQGSGAGAGAGGGGLLSPTATTPHGSRRHSSYFDDAAAASVTSAKEAIDLAILRSNMTAEGGQSANRFEIARNGRKVGVVTLARPSWRLGETVAMAVDFSGAELPCYAVHAALETAERVADPGLALRSEASVHRVTRRVYATSSEAALFSRRVVFSPTIPVSATPEFVTSGISLEWKIRLEFVVRSVPPSAPGGGSGPPHHHGEDDDGDDDDDDDDEEDEEDEEDEDDEGTDDGSSDTGSRRTERAALTPSQRYPPSRQQQPQQPHPLLEEVSRDDRGGLVLVAAETLACESFEVAVPLRVYGAVCNGLERLERDEAEEGLAV